MSDKEVKVRITGDISDLLKKLEKIKDAFEDLGDGKGSDKFLNNIVDKLKEAEKEAEDLVSTTKKLDGDTFEDMADGLEKVNKEVDEASDKYKEFNDRIADIETKNLVNMAQELKSMGKEVNDVTDKYKEFNDRIAKIQNNDGIKNMSESMKDFKDNVTEVGNVGLEKVNEQMQNIANSGEEVHDTFKKAFSFIDDISKDFSFNSDDLFGGSNKSSFFDNATEAIISGTIAGEKMASTLEGVTGSLKDAAIALGNMQFEELKQSVTYFDNLSKSIDGTDNKLLAATGQVDKLEEELESLYRGLEHLQAVGDWEFAKEIQDQVKALEDYRKKAEQVAEMQEKLRNETEDLYKEFEDSGEWGSDLFDQFKKVTNALDDFAKDSSKSFDIVEDNYRDLVQFLKKSMDDYGIEFGDDSLEERTIKTLQDLITYTKKYRNEIDAIEEQQRKLTNIQQDYLNEFDEQAKAYEKLSAKLKDFLADEEKGILVKEKLAKAYQKLHDAMTSMGAKDFLQGFKEVDDTFGDIGEEADDLRTELKQLMDKAISDAEEYRKTLSLVSYDRLKKELDDFGAALDDKTTKMLNFKHMQDEMDDATRKAAYSILNQVDALKKYADTAGFAVHINEWDEATDSFSRSLEGNADAVKRQREELQKNQKILEDYFRTMKESGKDVADRFFDDNGKFNLDKYIRELETFGMSMDQAVAKSKAYGQQALENLKYEKENAEAMKESAKKAKDNAEANLQKAKATRDAIQAEVDHAAKIKRTATSMEELQAATRAYENDSRRLADAKEEVAKAEKEYAEASEKAKNVDKDRIARGKEVIEQINKQRKALREMGADIKDITEGDIANFDKSLSKMFKDIFPDDMPKKFADFKEDFQAMFKSLGDFDFGGAFDIFKDIGAGLLDMVPTKFKAIAAAVVLVGKALKECADVGVNQLYKGFDTIGNVGDKLFDAFRDIGQEVRDAFENITDMQLDFGSIIEQVVEFEGTIAKVGVAAEASDSEISALEKRARELGATSRYSATDVATAMDELATAGWSVNDILTGIEGVVNLSEGSFMDLGKAAEFVANGLTAMGMSTNQANDLVDILSFSALKTSTDVNQMQRAFSNASSVAGTLGVSASDLATALGLMADQGVKGAKAGTALKNFMANMAAPTEKMTKCLKEYGLEGVQADIVNGNLMGGVIKLKEAFDSNNLSMKDQLKIITTLAGREALPGIAALMNNTAEEMKTLKFAVDSSTKSSRAYAESLGLINKEGDLAFESFEKMTEEQQKAYEQWQNFNSVLNDTSDAMYMVNGSTTDLGAIIHKLGEDGEVTSDQVLNLLDVFNKMDDGTKQVTDTLNKYGVEVVRTEEGTMDFGETIKNLGEVWDDLNESQKQQLLTQLGVNTSVEELNELFSNEGEKIEDLIDAYEKMEGVSEHLANTFDSTLKGSLLNLASAMEEQFLQAFDKVKPAVLEVTNTLTKGFDIWNGLAEGFGSGFVAAMEYVSSELSQQSEGWSVAISDGLHKAITSLDTLVNGGALDNILKIGTNIIKGIADGITRASNDGSLDSAITGAINKIATWCSENLDVIIEAGKLIIESISKGISENQDVIGEVIQSVIDMQTTIDGAVAFEKGRLFGENFATFIVKGIEAKLTEWGASFGGFLTGLLNIGPNGSPVPNVTDEETGEEWTYVPDYTGQTGGQWVKTGKTIGKDIGTGVNEGVNEEISNNKEVVAGTVDDNFKEAKVKTDQTASDIGSGISDNIMEKLESMDAAQLRVLAEELKSLQEVTQLVATGMTTSFTQIQDGARTSFMGLTNIMRNQMTNCTNIVRNQCINMSNIFRNQFVNMSNIANNQFLNVANNIRTHMTNCTNIVRNQSLNMSNIFRNQFVNMSNIVRNQMVNVSNIIRNQMVNCSNIVRNQSLNMSNIFRNQFVNMANIVRNQMTNCTNIIRNQCVNMSNIFRNQFVNMSNIARNQFVNVANIIRNQMTNCANIVRNQCINMANIFRNQFVNMANVARNQMVNISNIIRNQAVSWSNVIRNQVTNARNSLTTQMLSMAAVTRTQMVNITNIIRNQSTQWPNLVQSGASRAKSNFNSSFSGLASIARTQMASCLSIVKSYMNQIAAATSRTMTMNFKVNKSVTTTNITKNVTQGARATMGNINTNMRGIAQPSTMSTSMSNGSINLAPANNGISGSLALEIPVMLDGREIARASASYNQAELAKLEKRSNRKRGN